MTMPRGSPAARAARTLLSHTTLIALSAIFLVPFVWLLSTSLKSERHMNRFPPEWLPRGDFVQTGPDEWAEVVLQERVDDAGTRVKVQLVDRLGRPLEPRTVERSEIVTRTTPIIRHYAKGVSSFPFPAFLQNTLTIAVLAVFGTLLSCSLVAYSFAILQWPGRNKVFYLMLATMMLPGQVTMIPVFLIFRQLHWFNTYLPLIVPAFLGNAFFIFLLRQFFLTIPKDLIDAAKVDGCSELRIYWQIVLPLSKAALATVALFVFLGSWNDFMGPLIYLADEAKYTLSLGLAMFQGQHTTRYGELMAVSTLLTVPIIILFFFTQKTFIQGIKTSGMKG